MTGRQRPVFRGWRGWIGLLASALLLFLAFPPFDLSLLAFLGLVPLFWVCYSGTRPHPEGPAGPAAIVSGPGIGGLFLRGYVAGIAFYVLHLHWLLKLSKDEITIPWIMIPALGVLGAYLGIFWGLAVATAGVLRRRLGIDPVWGLPVCWTLFDWLRTLGETGFAWGSLGYALATVPAALQITAWTGFWVLPGWIVLTGGMLWRVIEAPGRAARRRWATGAVFVFGLPMLFGALVLRSADGTAVTMISPERFANGSASATPPAGRENSRGNPADPNAPPDSAPPLRFCLLQANTSREIKWEPDYREQVVEDLLARTAIAVERYHPDLVVWPETAAPLRILWETPLAQLTSATIDSLDTWTLVGTLDARLFEGRAAEHYNSAVLYDPRGEPVWRYAKRRMVPFGELTPYKRLLPFLSEINFGQSDFTMGTEPGLFQILGDRGLSCLICFESTFPELARGDVARGARVLVNITNDFWYGRSAGPHQHMHFAIHRAVENRTPLVRCANSGVSCVIDGYGRVFGETGLFVEEYVTAEVRPGNGGSFYTRAGDWPLGLLVLVLVGWITRGVVRRKREFPRRGN